jgi:hypothetical protein
MKIRGASWRASAVRLELTNGEPRKVAPLSALHDHEEKKREELGSGFREKV